MIQIEYVWIFNGSKGRFPGGVFTELAKAEEWIATNRLTGILTQYPVNVGCLDWAIENNLTSMSQEKLAQKRTEPDFIGSFSTASQEHYHYEQGVKQQLE